MRTLLLMAFVSLSLWSLPPLAGQPLDTALLVADLGTASQWIKKNDPRKARTILAHSLTKIDRSSVWADSVRYRIHRRLGVACRNIGAIDQAFENLDSAVVYATKVWGATHHRVAFLYGQHGNVYYAMGDYENARLFYQKDLDLELASQNPRDRDLGIAHYNLANSHFGLLDYILAEQHYQAALPLWKASFGPTHKQLRWIYNSLGAIYWEREMTEEAVTYYQLAMEIDLKNPAKSKALSLNLQKGGDSLQTGNYKQALTYYFSELEDRKRSFGKNHPLTAGCYIYIAHAYYRQEDYQAALMYYHEAVMRYVDNFSDTSIYAAPDTILQASSSPYLFEALQGKAKAFAQRYARSGNDRDLVGAYVYWRPSIASHR